MNIMEAVKLTDDDKNVKITYPDGGFDYLRSYMDGLVTDEEEEPEFTREMLLSNEWVIYQKPIKWISLYDALDVYRGHPGGRYMRCEGCPNERWFINHNGDLCSQSKNKIHWSRTANTPVTLPFNAFSKRWYVEEGDK